MLEATAVPGEVLRNIVETIAQALRLPFAAINLVEGGEVSHQVIFGKAQLYRHDSLRQRIMYKDLRAIKQLIN
jgi:hypothetical protein